jgi:hypothetical protein
MTTHFSALVLHLLILKYRFGVKPKDVASVLSQINVQCPPPPVCKAVTSPYRTPDGSCNNIKQSTWGQSRTQLQRILSPDYANGKNYISTKFTLISFSNFQPILIGIRLPRRANNGGELPRYNQQNVLFLLIQ